MTSPLPPPVRERIVLADALRGFALMGLYIVHMVEYFELYWYKPEPGWIHNLIFFLFGGKAYGVFALLFGLSFFIILDNYRQRGMDFRPRFCWRLLLLLAFGYLHSLLYAGDILQLLALCGFLLVVTHNFSTRVLMLIAAFFLLQVPHVAIIVWHLLQPSGDNAQPLFFNLMGRNFDMFAHASLPQLLAYNLLDGQQGKWMFFLETGRFWNIIGLMFAGAVLGRQGFFERRHSARALVIAIVIALGAFVLLTLIKPLLSLEDAPFMAQWSLQELVGYYINLSVIAAGVAIFVLLFQWRATGRLLALFAPAGRMTLTFYLGQSLVFVPVFYGFGLAAYDSWGQAWSLVAGLACWAVQLLIARWWLSNHRYGPMEWVWRKLTFIGFRSPTA